MEIKIGDTVKWFSSEFSTTPNYGKVKKINKHTYTIQVRPFAGDDFILSVPKRIVNWVG